MNKYKFAVELCGGYCSGFITVESTNWEDAKEKAMDSFVDRWCKAFPELNVDYNVELETVEIDKEEIKRKLEKAIGLLPYGEELEIAAGEDGSRIALRYLESRGSAESIDGLGEDEILWYEEDEELDDTFDRESVIDGYADYVSGF